MASSVKGYHGTSLSAWANISQGGPHSFRLSRNKYDWLGDGVYFWQDGPERAVRWAQKQHGSQAAVIEADIVLDDCLDLLDLSGKHQLINAYQALAGELQSRNLPLPTQTPLQHNLDRAVIEQHVLIMSTAQVRVKCVRSSFDEGIPLYPNSTFYDLAHIQIAVRDTSLIVNMRQYI